jgi:hypothetical protein
VQANGVGHGCFLRTGASSVAGTERGANPGFSSRPEQRRPGRCAPCPASPEGRSSCEETGWDGAGAWPGQCGTRSDSCASTSCLRVSGSAFPTSEPSPPRSLRDSASPPGRVDEHRSRKRECGSPKRGMTRVRYPSSTSSWMPASSRTRCRAPRGLPESSAFFPESSAARGALDDSGRRPIGAPRGSGFPFVKMSRLRQIIDGRGGTERRSRRPPPDRMSP